MRNPDIWTSGRVTRWHTHPVMNVHFQTDADHQWGVAALCLQLNPSASSALVYACIHHDCGEIGVADISFPNGQANPELRAMITAEEIQTQARMGVREFDLSDSDQDWLDMCDRLESIRFVRLRERWLLATPPWMETIYGVMGMAESLGCTDGVLEVLST
jgi:hypothetical protein